MPSRSAVSKRSRLRHFLHGREGRDSFKAAENQAVKQTTLNLTVKGETLLNDKGFSVSVPDIPAGEHAELTAEVAVGESADNYAFEVTSETAGEDEIKYNYGFLANDVYRNYAYHQDILDPKFLVKYSLETGMSTIPNIF
jgi:hypothetical protein